MKIHVSNVLSKLGVTDRTEAVTQALQRGIVALAPDAAPRVIRRTTYLYRPIDGSPDEEY